MTEVLINEYRNTHSIIYMPQPTIILTQISDLSVNFTLNQWPWKTD